ncbi:hypothetical protein ACFRFQ_17815 [Rhodococcus sp. NPDC056743]
MGVGLGWSVRGRLRVLRVWGSADGVSVAGVLFCQLVAEVFFVGGG